MEFVFREITLKAQPFTALRIEHQNRRRPDGIEAFEISRIFLDVHPERHKSFVDERCQTGITVGLGLQPSTGTSGRGGAEIYKKRFALFFRSVQCLIGIFDPVYGHDLYLHLDFTPMVPLQAYSDIRWNLNADKADQAEKTGSEKFFRSVKIGSDPSDPRSECCGLQVL